MTIGARFRQLRNSQEMTQDQIGEICEVTKSMVSQWESDTVVPSTDRLMMLKKKISYSIDWLLTGEGEMSGHGYFVSHPKLIAAVKVMEPLPEYGKDSAIKDLNEIAKLISQAKDGGENNGTHG